MMQPLLLITPCSRPHLLPALWADLRSQLDGRRPWRWYIAIEQPGDLGEIEQAENIWVGHCAPHPCPPGYATHWGNPNRNKALDRVKEEGQEGWVYHLDDDNLLHPRFLTLLDDFEQVHAPRGMLGFLVARQIHRDNTLRMVWTRPEDAADTAMFCAHTSVMAHHRWCSLPSLPAIYWILADRHLWWELWKRYQDQLVIYHETAAYYNAGIDYTGPRML